MRTIESATVHYVGEPLAGTAPETYTISFYLAESDYSPDDWGVVQADAKRQIARLYAHLIGDTPSWVAFDYEVAERAAREKEGP